jgi:hypothetical protein
MKITFFILIFVISLLFLTNTAFGQSSNENSLFFKIGDLFYWQNLQTGETISPLGTFVSILVSSLGPILIVLFIVIYAVKKRMKKSGIET